MSECSPSQLSEELKVVLQELKDESLSCYQFYRSVVVTVIAMGEVKVTVDDITDVISVGNSFVTASGTVNVAGLMAGALVLRCATYWVFLADF